MFRDVVFQDVGFQDYSLKPLTHISFSCEVPTPSVFVGQSTIMFKPHILKHHIPELPTDFRDGQGSGRVVGGGKGRGRRRSLSCEVSSAFSPGAEACPLGASRGFTILYYTILYYTIPYHTILYHTIPYYTILYYTILYYTILYHSIL